MKDELAAMLLPKLLTILKHTIFTPLARLFSFILVYKQYQTYFFTVMLSCSQVYAQTDIANSINHSNIDLTNHSTSSNNNFINDALASTRKKIKIRIPSGNNDKENNNQANKQDQTASQPIASNTVVFPTKVVTATRTLRALYDTPIPVNVITSEQLADNQVRTLKEALELLPNVTLQPVHGKTGYEIIMQGMSADQVLVLIDGMPITASTGSTVNLNQYLNVQVQQIEVVQGASSAQFGSSAMGGVINVITKKITTDANKHRFNGHISAELGTNGDQNPSGKTIDANRQYIDSLLNARIDTQGHLQARLSASYLNDNGLKDNGLQETDADWARLKDASEQRQVAGRLQYQLTPNIVNKQVWLEASHYTEEDVSKFNRRVAQNVFKRQKDEHITKKNTSAGFNYLFDSGVFGITALADTYVQGTFFYETFNDDSDTYSVTVKDDKNSKKTTTKEISIDRNADISTKVAQLQVDLPEIEVSSNHTHAIQLGTKWQQDELSQTNNGIAELTSDTVDRDVTELYAQHDWFLDNWELLTGIRFQNDSDFGNHIAPKFAVKYRVSVSSKSNSTNNAREHIFRASIGQGYRVPNLKERYFVFDHSVYGYMVMGNPNLQPETSISYQLGYEGKLSNTLNVTVNAFYNDIADLIQTDSKNPLVKNGVSIYRYQNVDTASTYGGDIGMNWQISKNNSLKANYSYTHTQNNSTNTELVKVPKQKANLYIKTQITPAMNLINHATYVSKHLVSTANKSYSPAWWSWNINANYQINDSLSIHAGINNLLNRQRDTNDPNDQSPVDNRQVVIGTKVNF